MRAYFRLPLLFAMASLAGCTTPAPPPPPQVSSAPPGQPSPPQPFFTQAGLASFYDGAHDGKLTASGETFDHHDFTAAHRTLAFGTHVRVTNLENGRSVTVAITDRGPHIKDRIIDLSAAAAQALGMKKDGVVRVKLEAFRTDQTS